MRANLEPALRRALEPRGYRVEVFPGAYGRGRSFSRLWRWVIDHHDAMPATAGYGASLRMLAYGRPGLSGPLCQIADERDGTTFIIADGKANHAGYGTCPDGSNPNEHIGRESRNAGDRRQPWPEQQMESIAIGDAAILVDCGQPASHCRGHKEVDPKRKIDPTYDMSLHRARVAVEQTRIGSPVPPEGDWFDMADEAALERVVEKVINRSLDARLKSMTPRIITSNGFAADPATRKERVWYWSSGPFTWGPMTEDVAQYLARETGVKLDVMDHSMFVAIVDKNGDMTRRYSEPLKSNWSTGPNPIREFVEKVRAKLVGE